MTTVTIANAVSTPTAAIVENILTAGVVPEDGAMCRIPRERIRRNPNIDPRKHRNRAKYESMIESFRRDGILQAITVRPVEIDAEGRDFEVVMGNSRFDGAGEVDIPLIPATVRHVDVREAAIMAGIENMQRADLSPVEEGFHAAALLKELNNDHDEVCRVLDWSRAKLTSRVLLTHVIEPVQAALVQNDLKIGHVELLAGLPSGNQLQIMNRIIESKMSVGDARERLKQGMRNLGKACFDTNDCSGCQYNSTTSADLFADSMGKGLCSNAACWEEKVQTHISAVQDEAQQTYGTVHIDKSVPPDSMTLIEATGQSGVGRDQKVICASCQHYGAVISTRYGREGQVTGDMCFNRQCNTEKVQAYQSLIASDRQPNPSTSATQVTPAQANTKPGAGSGKTTKPSAPVTASPATLKKGIKREAMKRFCAMGEVAVSETPSLGLSICLLTLYRDVSHKGNYAEDANSRAEALMSEAKKAAQALKPLGDVETDDDQLLLARLTPGQLGTYMVKMASLTVWEKDGADQFEKHRPTRQAMRYGIAKKIDRTGYTAVTEAYMKAQTKGGLIEDCKKSGFTGAYDAAKGAKAFSALSKGKASELIDAIKTFDFDWAGYEPLGFDPAFYDQTLADS